MIWVDALLYDVLSSPDLYDFVPELDYNFADVSDEKPIVMYRTLTVLPQNGPYKNLVTVDVSFTILADTYETSMMVSERLLDRIDMAHTVPSEYGWVTNAIPTSLPIGSLETSTQGVSVTRLMCHAVIRHD